ncbi:unnamed protein product [Darwinula stevensoni]|uniref:Uncharacterized protein n=1 Tax=Darwinula stevensoni TaxID=69355 RepID=A0A7R8ZZH8_9CRUS|nr:unnamed protein product [Darwinula stevensoni]CAG0883726.1 unnamed protein product [Darwinula stevensoni]
MGSPGFMSFRVKKSCFFRLLLVVALVQTSRGDLFSWIFGEDEKVQSKAVVSKPTASNLKDLQPSAGDDELVDPPFEVVDGEVFTSISKNDDFLKMLQESAPGSLSELDLCQHEVILRLKTSCQDLSEEEISKLSVQLLNCQSRIEGRVEYACTDKMTLRECTSGMDSTAWNSYHIMSNRARAVCYTARQFQFQVKTQKSVNDLFYAAKNQISSLENLHKGQEKLKGVTQEAFEKVSEGQQEFLQQQGQIQSAHLAITAHISQSLQGLRQEKMLMDLFQHQLLDLAHGLQAKLENAGTQLALRDGEQEKSHHELLSTVHSIQMQLQEAALRFSFMNEEMQKQHQKALLDLEKINGTMHSLALVLEKAEKLDHISSNIGFQLDYLVQTVGCLVMLLIGASLFDIPKPLTLLLALGIIADAPIQYRQNVIPLLGAALFFWWLSTLVKHFRKAEGEKHDKVPGAVPDIPERRILANRVMNISSPDSTPPSPQSIPRASHGPSRPVISDSLNIPGPSRNVISENLHVPGPSQPGTSSENNPMLTPSRRSLPGIAPRTPDLTYISGAKADLLQRLLSDTSKGRRSSTPSSRGSNRSPCLGTCRSGEPCRNSAMPPSDFCRVHTNQGSATVSID